MTFCLIEAKFGALTLTQSEFGRILAIGQTQLSKYEMGQSAPTLEILLKLKSYSGRSIDWIATGEDEGPSKNRLL